MKRGTKLKAFVSRSGGKDAVLSWYLTSRDFQVTCLLNMVAEDGEILRSHGVRPDEKNGHYSSDGEVLM